MTTFQVTHNWAPQLIAQDKALKEKYGNSDHFIPTSSYASTLNNTNQDQFSSSTVAKDNDNSKKKIKNTLAFLGSGLAAALFGVVIIRKKRPVSSQMEPPADLVVNRMNNWIKQCDVKFTSEPVVTNLKNGGFKYEFKNPHFENTTNVFIFDKAGQFKKYLTFTKDSSNRISSYDLYNKPFGDNAYLVKRVDIQRKSPEKFATKFNDSIKIKNRDKDGYFQHSSTDIKGNDKAIFVDRITPSAGSFTTTMFFDNGKNIVTSQIVSKGNKSVDYIMKPGQQKTKVDNFSDYLTEQQKGDMLELVIGSRTL